MPERRRMSIVDATTFVASSLIVLTPTAKAGVAIGLANVNPDFPDHCIDDNSGKPYPLGSRWGLPNCGMATCQKRGKTMYVSYESCGAVQAMPPCRTTANLTASYPLCCPRVVCDPPPAPSFFDATNEIDIDEYGLYDDELYMMSSDNNVQYLPFHDYPDVSEYQQQIAPESVRYRVGRAANANNNNRRRQARSNGDGFGPKPFLGGVFNAGLFSSQPAFKNNAVGADAGSSSSLHNDIYQAAESVAIESSAVINNGDNLIASGSINRPSFASTNGNANNNANANTANNANGLLQQYKPYSGEQLNDNRPRFFVKLPSVAFEDTIAAPSSQQATAAVVNSSVRRNEETGVEPRLLDNNNAAAAAANRRKNAGATFDLDKIFAGTILA